MTRTETISLRDTERAVFASSLHHGLWDILVGAVALAFAFLPYFKWSVLFWPILVPVVLWLRARVVAPRLGAVRFGEMRLRRLQGYGWVLLGVGVLALVVARVVSGLEWVGAYGGAIRLGVFFVIPLWLAALGAGLTRFYAYGVLLGVAPVAGEWLYQQAGVAHHGIVVTFGVAAAVILSIGIVLFIRLLRIPPLPLGEEPEDKER